MDLSKLKAPKGATKKRKRIGRGPGSTWGKTSGKGQKGQNSRSGGGVRPGFEGGQMPLHRRIPKTGFHNKFSKEIATLNVRDLEKFFDDGATVDLEALCEKGLIPARFVDGENGRKVRLKVDGVKILGDGDLAKKLIVRVHKLSASAKEKIRESWRNRGDDREVNRVEMAKVDISFQGDVHLRA